MKKKRLKQFASVVLTLTLAVQPVIAGAQELFFRLIFRRRHALKKRPRDSESFVASAHFVRHDHV